MSMHDLSRIRRTGLVLLALLAAASFLITYGWLVPNRVHAQNTLGGPLPGLTSGQLQLFNVGEKQFAVDWIPVKGLGPIYMTQSCALCHAQPVIGGTSSNMRATYFGAVNSDGSFDPLTNEGGYLLQVLSVAPFIRGCKVAGEIIPTNANVVSNRLPPELFGAGLIDSIPDQSIINNSGSKGMGIDGDTNMVLDYNGKLRVGHFGEKAHFASLLQATGFTFGHYIGVTNPVDLNEDCPNAAPGTPSCPTTIVPPICTSDAEPNDRGKETIQIFDFQVFLAQNTPGTGNANGQALFTSIGCVLCHTTSYTTAPKVTIPLDFHGHRSGVVAALSNQTVNLYSDLLIHHMGPALADCMTGIFGQAEGDQWRTTPLWGLSTRSVYLHDGRASDLMTTIEDHMSLAGQATACTNTYGDSEANQVISNFNALSPSDQADLIAFINSL